MPLPKPRAEESNNQFISRCMIDDVMTSEYPQRTQRYAVCNNLLSQKTLETKQAQRNISKEFVKQIKIAHLKKFIR